MTMAGRFPRYQIAIANLQRAISLDVRQLRRMAEGTLFEEQVHAADISVALVNDAEIWRVNKQFLNHDHPTDVVSFQLESEQTIPPESYGSRTQRLRGAGKTFHGEIVIGAEYAQREAAVYRWPVQHEVLLYLVHGLLHLCGYDDLSPAEKRTMRRRETAILHRCGITGIPRRRPRSSHGGRERRLRKDEA